MKKTLIIALATGVLATLSLGNSVSAAPYCGITWGSLPKTASDSTSNDTLTNVRTGRHDCYDRMVVDVSGASTGYDVRYVPNVYADGSGQLIPLTGGAKLQVIVKAPSHTLSGTPTYPATVGQPLPGVNLAGYQTFKSAKFAGSFEGQSTIGLGVRATLPFQVTKLGNRVVVDVAHNW
jgi:hypothetical protein